MRAERPLMLQPGEAVAGRYEVVALIGEGAMGAVYEATERATGRGVAIKVLHPEYVRVPDIVRRFDREASVAAAVGHPGVVEVFDRGTHEGAAFLVMALLRGETLAARLDRDAALAPAASVEIAGRVLSALAAAHAKGIIHRDLKPENVFLVADGGDGGVKLIDFGVSKFRRAQGSLDHSTLEGTLFGTPGYMAPEQCMGQRDIDHRADVFAVGALLYEMLTGRLPFVGAHRGELFLEVVRGKSPPEPPSRLAPALPTGLDQPVLRALERDRSRRFGSAREFLDALRPFGASAIDAVSLPPVAPIDQDDEPPAPLRRPTRAPRRPGARRRPGFAVATLLSLALLSLAAIVWRGRSAASRDAAALLRPVPPPGARVAARPPAAVGVAEPAPRPPSRVGRVVVGAPPPARSERPRRSTTALDALPIARGF